jgi:hypothetical protein
MAYPGEQAILDGQFIPRSSLLEGVLDNGVFQIEGMSHVRVTNLTIINSHDAGFTIRDSDNIDLINNSTRDTFSSGIAVWNTKHDEKQTKRIRILGNSIDKAQSLDVPPHDWPARGELPHEALSVGGAIDFEVAYNHIYDGGKEGIDIKETSNRGRVHHNHVHNQKWQGLYVDAWFGTISDIEIFSNVVHDCGGAGLVLSVENGQSVENVKIHNNLIFDNSGSGLYFSKWGVNNVRRRIQINNNTFYHNGYGTPKLGQTYYWMTGGLYLYTTNLRDISVSSNIFSDNQGFQMGYSELFLKEGQSWQSIARAKNIQITDNLIEGTNNVNSPIESGGDPPDRVQIYAVNASRPIFGNPLFRNPASQDFTLRRDSPAVSGKFAAGAYAPGSRSHLWWQRDFPPTLH